MRAGIADYEEGGYLTEAVRRKPDSAILFDKIAKVGFDPVYGARPLKRAIQQVIENPIARLVLEGKFGPKDVIPVDFEEGNFSVQRVVH